MKPSAVSGQVFLWTLAILVVGSATGFGQGGRRCSDSTLKGRYAFTESGSILEIGPVAVAGVFDADGKGNLVTTDTVSLDGTIIGPEHLSFTYQVNPDCTGTAATVSSTPPEAAAHFNFIIIGNGKEAIGIHTDDGTTLLLKAKKQFAGNRAN